VAVARYSDWQRFAKSSLDAMIFRDYQKAQKGLWWSVQEKGWLQYFDQFKPKFHKPSVGTMAVFMAFERWGPEKIGLIGFDWVLDDNPEWFHDSRAEREAIYSLGIEIIDLRNI
jgi:hypothetical protein